MTINGHLLLLVVATGLFVRVWSANDQSRSRFVPRARSQAAVASPPDPAAVSPGFAVLHKPVSASATTTAPTEEVWTIATCPIPLPAGMTAGNYHVADDTGRIARLEIVAAETAVHGTSAREVPADFHMMSVGPRKWYFIRLQTPVAIDLRDTTHNSIANAAPGAESNVRPFMNRKFDFTGYVTSSQPDESVIEQIAQPDPPELPVSR